MSSVSISLKGTRTYANAVGILAKKHNTTTGKLVRQVLDEKYGEEIAQIMEKNFADDETEKTQTRNISVDMVHL